MGRRRYSGRQHPPGCRILTRGWRFAERISSQTLIPVGANQRQFVGKSDVDVAEAVFRQLAHLGGARVGHHAFAFKEDFIQLAGASEQTGDMPPITRSF